MHGPFVTRSRNVDSAWRSIVDTIVDKGAIAYTERKKQKTLECLCGIVHLTDWRTGGITPHNYIGLSPEVIEQQYWPQYSSSEKGEHTYTYGWCMRKRFGFNQIQHVVDTIKKGNEVAFAQFWNPVEDTRSPDPPCIDIVAFHKVKEKVNLIEYIRSNDVARAWPEDVSGSYAVFLTEVASHFGGVSARGDIITVSGSAHIYDTTLEEIRERFQSSYSSSNQKPVENTSPLFGPVVRAVQDTEKCCVVVQKVVEDYSRVLEDAKLYLCLKVQPRKEKGVTGLTSTSTLESGKLVRALRHFEGKNDEGKTEILDQLAWASSKVVSIPQSRRILVTPNNPWEHEYSLNPLIIQFLVREGMLHTIALYHDVKVEDADEHYTLLKAISDKIRGRTRTVKPGPIIMIFAPVRF
jgi:thymidylate synthase